jgi:hypothetical protein
MPQIVGQTDNPAMPCCLPARRHRSFAIPRPQCVVPFAVVALALAACTPSLNWRELALDPTPLKLTLPCKPDSAERKLEMLPGREVVVHALGCEAAGATYVVLYADIGSAADLAAAMEGWKKASLASIHGVAERERPAVPAGALALPASTLVTASGTRANGRAVQSQAEYFAKGTLVFQAAVYSERITPELAEPFFAGLRFQ